MKSVDQKPMKLSEFRGKHVLLDFWTTWSGAGIGSFPYLAAVQEAYGKQGRLVVLSVNLDRDPRLLESWLAWKQPSWRQVTVGDWMRTPILGQYGATGLASAFLISPDGKLLARDLSGPQIEAAVRKALD